MPYADRHPASRGEKGQTLVELAFLIMMLLFVLFGVMEYGRAWFYSNTLTNGVRDGARYASTLSNATSFEAKVILYTKDQVCVTQKFPSIKRANVYANVSAYTNAGVARARPYGGSLQSGDTVKVIARYKFTLVPGSVVPFMSRTTVLVRQASMRYE